MSEINERVVQSVDQGSEEWLRLRKGYFPASEAPIMLGYSKYKKREELILEKLLDETPPVDSFTQKLFDRGHESEALARPIAEGALGCLLPPIVFTRGNLLASLDGFNFEHNVVFEHKLLNSQNRSIQEDGDLPPQYWAQVEQQLYVAGVDRCLFVVSDGTPKTDNYFSLIYRSRPERLEEVLEGWKKFAGDLRTADVEKLKIRRIQDRNDDEYLSIASRLVQAQREADEKTAIVDELKKQIKELVGKQATRGGGVTLSYTERSNTNYRKACEDAGLDLSNYVRPSSSFQIRVTTK